ncbi:MAG TPA: biotin--[acetyl-CoA-carboxylase] ligase [Fastidiosipila sp.]|nr:biotin--[acetyl-CoA-carboxylase] ligase [Fastidiosipila sp.]
MLTANDRQPVRIFTNELVGSTNVLAARLKEKGESLPFAVLADGQTKGKGRYGRSFFSPAGSGFYFTYATHMRPLPPGQITCLAAVASAEAVFSIYDIELEIKWINDLMFDKKKTGGILTEKIGDDLLLIGIGINIWTTGFPDDLKDKATSLFSSEPKDDRRVELATTLSEKLETALDAPIENAMQQYRERLIKDEVSIMGGDLDQQKAWIVDVLDDGRLEVRLSDDTVKTLADGEVQLQL